jgi:BlaI family transcriptional regulator, penicillinase repressor
MLKFEKITTLVVEIFGITTFVVTSLSGHSNLSNMSEKTYEPTDAELEILQVIWELEPVTVRDIYDRIVAKKEVGYTTVLKQVQRLTEKGVLIKDDVQANHLYRAAVQESSVKQQLAGKMLQTAFGGSALQMMMHALGQDKASPPGDLQELKAWLDQKINKEKDAR